MKYICHGSSITCDGDTTAQVRSVECPSVPWTVVDATTLDSEDDTIEKMKGMRDPGDYSFVLALSSGQASHAAFLTLHDSGDTTDWDFTLRDGTVGAFSGWVKDFKPNTITSQNLLEATCTVQVTTKITWTPAGAEPLMVRTLAAKRKAKAVAAKSKAAEPSTEAVTDTKTEKAPE